MSKKENILSFKILGFILLILAGAVKPSLANSFFDSTQKVENTSTNNKSSETEDNQEETTLSENIKEYTTTLSSTQVDYSAIQQSNAYFYCFEDSQLQKRKKAVSITYSSLLKYFRVLFHNIIASQAP